jgi:hypothetical protein
VGIRSEIAGLNVSRERPHIIEMCRMDEIASSQEQDMLAVLVAQTTELIPRLEGKPRHADTTTSGDDNGRDVQQERRRAVRACFVSRPTPFVLSVHGVIFADLPDPADIIKASQGSALAPANESDWFGLGDRSRGLRGRCGTLSLKSACQEDGEGPAKINEKRRLWGGEVRRIGTDTVSVTVCVADSAERMSGRHTRLQELALNLFGHRGRMDPQLLGARHVQVADGVTVPIRHRLLVKDVLTDGFEQRARSRDRCGRICVAAFDRTSPRSRHVLGVECSEGCDHVPIHCSAG